MTETAIDLDGGRRIHLVGIGGAGISAIAIVLAQMGNRVSGVDVVRTGAWPALERAGVAAEIADADDLFRVPEGVEIIAHSSAFAPGPEDHRLAEAAGCLLLDRAGILAEICRRRTTVGVAGTHGKTSTTAMLATLLDGAGADPSFLVGSVPVGLDVAARWGGDDGLFVVEADESDGSFLELGVTTALVTNVDEDHLDRWGDLDGIEAAFDRYVGGAERAIVCIDDPAGSATAEERALRIARRHDAVTVGEALEARHRLHGVRVDRLTTTFGLRLDGEEIGPITIGTPGRHHARNAAMAVVAAVTHGVDAPRAVNAVGAYRGVARRFTVTGEASGVTVVDDYAHNPGKIRALIASAKEAGWRRVMVLFQPQRYSRTAAQARDFGASLSGADLIAVTDIYPAGEDPQEGIDGRLVLDALLDERPWADAAWTPALEDAVTWAAARTRPGDLVLTVGAGDVHRAGPMLLERLGAAR